MSPVHHQYFNMVESKTFTEIYYCASEIQEGQDVWCCLKAVYWKGICYSIELLCHTPTEV